MLKGRIIGLKYCDVMLEKERERERVRSALGTARRGASRFFGDDPAMLQKWNLGCLASIRGQSEERERERESDGESMSSILDEHETRGDTYYVATDSYDRDGGE